MKCPHCDKEIEFKFADPSHFPYQDYPTPVAADGLPGIAVKLDPNGNIIQESYDAVFDPGERRWHEYDNGEVDQPFLTPDNVLEE